MSFRDIEQSIVSQTIDILGRDITYTPITGDPVEIKGLFDNAYVEIDGMMSLKAILRIDLADLALLPAKGDEVTIASTDYAVTESREDGHGGTTLILMKV
jgi:hypothetical protein